jgi:hypothetical protein
MLILPLLTVPRCFGLVFQLDLEVTKVTLALLALLVPWVLKVSKVTLVKMLQSLNSLVFGRMYGTAVSLIPFLYLIRTDQ